MYLEKTKELFERETGLSVEEADAMDLEDIQKYVETKKKINIIFPKNLSPFQVDSTLYSLGLFRSPEEHANEARKLKEKYL